MHLKNSLKPVSCLLILSLLLLPLFPVRILAGGNGSHINVDRTDESNVLIIGDSRVVGMDTNVGQVSYVATVGGHHLKLDTWLTGKWRHKPLVIAASQYKDANYYRQMVSIVQNSLKTWKSCIIVIEATPNDIGFVNWVEKSKTRMTWLGKKLGALSVKINGKKYKPVVYYLALVPERGNYKTSYLGYNVMQFNRALQKAVGGTRYIGIGSILNWANLYNSDGTHFTGEGDQYYFSLVTSKIRRSGAIIGKDIVK